MAWCYRAISHYLSHWARSMSPNGAARQQWLNKSVECCVNKGFYLAFAFKIKSGGFISSVHLRLMLLTIERVISLNENKFNNYYWKQFHMCRFTMTAFIRQHPFSYSQYDYKTLTIFHKAHFYSFLQYWYPIDATIYWQNIDKNIPVLLNCHRNAFHCAHQRRGYWHWCHL